MRTIIVVVALSMLGAVPPARAAEHRSEYQLDRLPILSRVIISVNDNYFDPARIEPRKMVAAALAALSKPAPEVAVHVEPDGAAVSVQVGGDSRRVDLGRVDTIWKVRTALQDPLVFVAAHLPPERDRRELEFAAIDGILSTLDRHTVFLRPGVLRKLAPEEGRASPVEPEVTPPRSVGGAALLEGGIAYVRLTRTLGGCAPELAAAIAEQARRAGGALRGLVLDLRGDPGGLLEEAVKVADLFLAEGVIATFAGDGKAQRIRETKWATQDPGDLLELPVVVLVDRVTASGAELVAMALQENGRALIVGSPTFGLDMVQAVHDFFSPGDEDRLGLKISIARFSTPRDGGVRQVGIAPDVVLRPEEEDADAGERADTARLVAGVPVQRAREILARAPAASRGALLETAKALAAEHRAAPSVAPAAPGP